MGDWDAGDWAAFSGAIIAIITAIVGGIVTILNAVRSLKNDVREVKAQNVEAQRTIDKVSAVQDVTTGVGNGPQEVIVTNTKSDPVPTSEEK